MKPLRQLANHGFHEAAGSGQSPDHVWGAGLGHVRSQRGLQINPDRSQFGLHESADVALVAND